MTDSNRDRRKRATQEAAAWLARHEAGTIDREAFERWRAAHPDHEIAFARALAIWDQVGNPASPSASTPTASAKPGRTRRQLLGAMAATGCAGILTAGGFATRAYAWHSASSSIGECKRLILPDGSEAMLNTNSKLDWRFSKAERSLWIERGEIGLDLQAGCLARLHGEGRTALLSSGRFNIRLRAGSMDVTILRGKAAAGSAAPTGNSSATPQQIVAASFQNLLLSSAEPAIRPASQQQIATTIAWQQGEILFNNVPLQAATEEYNRYLTRKIVIADPELAGIPIGGRFTSTDPAPFLSALALGLDIHVVASEQEILLTR